MAVGLNNLVNLYILTLGGPNDFRDPKALRDPKVLKDLKDLRDQYFR